MHLILIRLDYFLQKKYNAFKDLLDHSYIMIMQLTTQFYILNKIPAFQSRPTSLSNEKIDMLLDYLATHSDAKVRSRVSDMILRIYSDTAYLVLPNA